MQPGARLRDWGSGRRTVVGRGQEAAPLWVGWLWAGSYDTRARHWRGPAPSPVPPGPLLPSLLPRCPGQGGDHADRLLLLETGAPGQERLPHSASDSHLDAHTHELSHLHTHSLINTLSHPHPLTHTHAHTHIQTHIHSTMHKDPHPRTHPRTQTHTHAHTHPPQHRPTPTLTHSYTRTHRPTPTHTPTQTHTHSPTHKDPDPLTPIHTSTHTDPHPLTHPHPLIHTDPHAHLHPHKPTQRCTLRTPSSTLSRCDLLEENRRVYLGKGTPVPHTRMKR